MSVAWPVSARGTHWKPSQNMLCPVAPATPSCGLRFLFTYSCCCLRRLFSRSRLRSADSELHISRSPATRRMQGGAHVANWPAANPPIEVVGVARGRVALVIELVGVEVED